MAHIDRLSPEHRGNAGVDVIRSLANGLGNYKLIFDGYVVTSGRNTSAIDDFCKNITKYTGIIVLTLQNTRFV